MLKIILDALIINLCFILAYHLRFKVLLFITPGSMPIFEQYLRTLIFITLIWLAVFKLIGLYEEKKFSTLIDELAALFVGVSFATLILVGLLFLYRELWFSRLVIANAWWIALVILSGERILIYGAQKSLYRYGIGRRKTLIVGAGDIGQTLALKINQDKTSGYEAIGFVDDHPLVWGKTYQDLPILGSLEKIAEIVKNQKINEVIIADISLPTEKILEIITECEKYGVEFKLVPGILELIASRVNVEELAGVPLLTVEEIRLKGFQEILKRSADIALSGLAVVFLSPLLLITTLLIKFTSPGPIFFKQKRIGKEEKIFAILKFRSMIVGAEAYLPHLESLAEVKGHLFKMKDDPRLTPLGRYLRRWSIDELPQLFNVLKGEMSLVGPRPPLPQEVEKYSSWHKKRLRVRPGITGLWQVSGRSRLPFEDMVRLDIYYIENWSLWLDLKIIFRTALAVISGKGAY